MQIRHFSNSPISRLLMIFYGLIFISVGVFSAQFINPDSSWTRVNGKVISVSQSLNENGNYSYAPTVEYFDNKNNRHIHISSVSTGGKPTIGSGTEIAYNPENPSQAKVIQPFWVHTVPLSFVLLGSLVVVVQIVGFIKDKKRKKEVDRLTEQGIRLEGVVTDVINETPRRSLGYSVVVTAQDSSGDVREYKSQVIHGIPLSLINADKDPIRATVFIDSSDPSKYYVDTDSLPKLTGNKIKDLFTSDSNHDDSRPDPPTPINPQTPFSNS